MVFASDIAVLGSGPAALSVGAAAARLGCDVSIIAPNPQARWTPNYCLWADQVPARFASTVERQWEQTFVATPRGERVLDRAYAKLDGRALAESLWSDLGRCCTRVVDGRAVSIEHGSDTSRVTTFDGSVVDARVVIDASGAQSPFVERTSTRAAAHQIAYGVLLDAPGHGFDRDRVVLMDFRPADPDDNEPPSFLYVLPLSGDRLFLEETSLAHRPAVSFGMLRARLSRRLEALGLDGCSVLDHEYCCIPMGIPLPVARQNLVPFGAAASMVHPASGYSVGHSLRKAEPVAHSICHALASSGRDAAIHAGNSAVWPAADRKAWELYALGLESLVDMSAAQTSDFFHGFFEMPAAHWAGFLAGTLSPREVASIMASVFRIVPSSVRWHLFRSSVSNGLTPLAKLFLQPGTA